MRLKNQTLNPDGTYRLKNQREEETKPEVKKPKRRVKKNG